MELLVDHEVQPKDLKGKLPMMGINGKMSRSNGVSGELHHPWVYLLVEIELWIVVLHVLLHVIEAQLIA